jgi:SsrA-binding protein
MHRREIERFRKATERDGLTLIPLNIYLKGPLVKVTVALAKGKKLYDKRDAEKQREARRDMERGQK